MTYLKLGSTFLVITLLLYVVYFLYKLDNDEYYRPWFTFNCKQIPLIKPYRAGNCGGSEWILDYGGEFGDKIVSINIIDSIIIAEKYDKSIPKNLRDTTWFIYIPRKYLRYEFKNKASFDQVVVQYTKKTYKTKPTEEVFSEFIDIGYLEWFPKDIKRKFHIWRII